MNEKELKRIEALANAARPGPWKSYIEGRDHSSGSDFIMIGESGNQDDVDLELIGATRSDQDFIASARQDVPKLVSEVRKLQKEIRKLKNA